MPEVETPEVKTPEVKTPEVKTQEVETKNEPVRLRGKAFLFTCHNNHEAAIEALKNIKYNYLLIGGYEQGETQAEEKKHFHAFVQFDKIIGLKRILTKLNKFGHLDIIHKGKSEDIKNYCIKLEKDGFKVKEKFENQKIIFEDGEFKNECYGAGARTDILTKIKNNKTINEFIENETELYLKYRNGINDIYRKKNLKNNLEILAKRRHQKILVEYHTGKSGSGKTYYLEEMEEKEAKENEHIAEIQPVNNEFWEVVAGTEEDIEILFINEFRDGDIKLNKFLQILEGRGSLPIKGGSLNLMKLKKIYIASIKKPWDIYRNQNEDVKGQIKRRITIYKHKNENGIYTMKKIEWKENKPILLNEEMGI